MGVGGRLKHAWNAFFNMDPVSHNPYAGSDLGASYASRPDRVRYRVVNERSIITSIYTRIAIDVSSVDIRHVRLDDQKRYKEDIASTLNECLTVEANIDQTGRELVQDIVATLFADGAAALVPVETTINPESSSAFDILNMRVGNIVQWYPKHVRVSLYNEITGRREELVLPKRNVAIVYNPLYDVMNEPNSTLQRLIMKLGYLDAVDQQSASGKLDMIIQLPYVIKTETKRAEAEKRRKDIELQLKGSQYGIAYTDGTEKITQLNRPAENNLMKQVEFLTEMLYGQLGITEEVMLGTAEEAAMLNYFNRTVEPILGAIADEIKRKFLSKTARTQGQTIMYFRDPFKLVPMKDLAELADKFTRNEIVSSNEFRGFIGMKPDSDPKSDELRNSNMPQSELGQAPTVQGEVVNDGLDGLEGTLDGIISDLEADLGEVPDDDDEE